MKACGHYTNSVRAVQEALRLGYDEAILLNTSGDVAEGSGANLFVVKNGTVITNDIDASIDLLRKGVEADPQFALDSLLSPDQISRRRARLSPSWVT